MALEKGVILYKADGTVEVLHPEKKPNLTQLQKWVGGNIEYAPAILDGKKVSMIVNEEGLLIGLPFNRNATALYRGVNPQGAIVGDAVVLIGWR